MTTHLDEIDQWLFDSFGILSGACSSIENLRHSTARMVAEVLWPKKAHSLTWEDIETIVDLYNDVHNDFSFDGNESNINAQKHYEEVLRRFNEQRKK